MGALNIVTAGQPLTLAAATDQAGTPVTVYDAAGMVDADPTADPPVVGDEVTLPLALTGDGTVYLHDGAVVLTLTEVDGALSFTETVVIGSGVGTLTVVQPQPSLTQLIADTVQPKVYPSADRPDPATMPIGFQIFDTTLGRSLWSNGTTWVDALGNPA
jgi:hypothetical protein